MLFNQTLGCNIFQRLKRACLIFGISTLAPFKYKNVVIELIKKIIINLEYNYWSFIFLCQVLIVGHFGILYIHKISKIQRRNGEMDYLTQHFLQICSTIENSSRYLIIHPSIKSFKVIYNNIGIVLFSLYIANSLHNYKMFLLVSIY